MRLHFLKTEWSDIIILQDGEHAAFVDTGMADQFPEIQEYLDQLGIRKLDFILLTHFHRDHYGCIPALVEQYPVGTVYLKEYSGLDYWTAWGSVADDAYRTSEMEKYQAMQQLIREKSTLRQAEDVAVIPFGDTKLQLFSTPNVIRTVYEDASHPETYHKILYSENKNSLSVLMKVNGVTVFLGGDMQEEDGEHPLVDHMTHRVAEQIGVSIDIYKAPHHGTPKTAERETLQIFRPKHVVITNGDEYLSSTSDVYELLRGANPEVEIHLTEKQHVVCTIEPDGTIRF